MAQQSLARSLVLALITPLVLLGASASVLWFQIMRMQDDTSWAAHSQIVLKSANEAMFQVLTAQTSVRGFQPTGDSVFLENFSEAKPDEALQALIARVQDNPSQASRAEDFRRAYHA